MRSRTAVACLGVLTLASGVALASSGQAAETRPQPIGTRAAHAQAMEPARAAHCYQQLDNDNGIGVISQNFEAQFDAYDSRGADDFTLSSNCQVRQVEVRGSYISGSGPIASANVTIYRDGNGKPAGITTNQQKLKVVDDGDGNLTIKLRTGVGLVAGGYWLSVQVNMDYNTGGEWGWNTNDSVRGTGAMWRNEPNGFATGCVHYTSMASCIDAGQGGDFAFAVDGK